MHLALFSSNSTVGSCPRTSSSTSALAIALLIAGVGRVTVSDRKSTDHAGGTDVAMGQMLALHNLVEKGRNGDHHLLLRTGLGRRAGACGVTVCPRPPSSEDKKTVFCHCHPHFCTRHVGYDTPRSAGGQSPEKAHCLLLRCYVHCISSQTPTSYGIKGPNMPPAAYST